MQAQIKKFVSDKQVAERFSVHRTTPWRWVQEGKFPKPIKLSVGVTRWKLSDIEAWEIEQGAAK